MTARNATIATATVLVSRARSISPCRCALMWRAFVAIQKIIHVISATASREVIPANASAASSLSSSLTNVSASPSPTDSAIAAPTPIHSRCSAWPLLVFTR